MQRMLCTLFASLLLISSAFAQEAMPQEPPSTLDAYTPLDLPTPNEYRAGSGEPGEAYWQQQADYHIAVTLDPTSHRVSGKVTIKYVNNAPKALEYLWLQLDQNLFAEGSRGARLQPPTSRWSGSFAEGGYDITSVALVRNGTRSGAKTLIDDTRMRIDLRQPLAPGGTAIDIEIDYSFVIPQYGADRMGRLDVEQGTVYELAQWYPRMYVFDDVEGWNPMPYLGQGEFYLEYGDYDFEITVPRDFIVVATGSLENPDEVLTETQQERLNKARTSQKTVKIVEPGEVGKASTRPDGQEMLTWKFHAENVRDVAWAASQAFIWDAASWNGIMMMSAYPKEGIGNASALGWEESTQYTLHAIRHYSEKWFQYPYPVAINVAGVVGGMEYPMIVFCSVQARDQGLFGVTDHEFGHSWFPMIVGSDERRYAWMDEGFNTFINYYSNLDFYGDDATRTERVSDSYIAGLMQDPSMVEPIATYPDRIRREGLGFLAYRKPGAGLVLLRDYILGPERFDSAFREYIEDWAYKHPKPADFFRTIENVSGEDLDWFWRGWFYETGTFDQAIGGVAANEDGTTYIQVRNEGKLVMPALLAVTYADGSTERMRVPAEAFFTSAEHFVTVNRTDIVRVQLDPDQMLPDIDRDDDGWSIEGGVMPPKAKGE